MPITVIVVIRSVIAFFSLLLLVRLMGKQQVAQLTSFDYIVGITIGSMASTLSVQLNENLLSTLAGLATWAILAIVVAVLSVHSVWVRKIVDGEATILVANGKLLEANLKQVRIPIEQLLSEFRIQEVFNITDIEFAMLEPGGKISIQKKSQKQTLTPNDLNILPQYDGLPTNLIVDGMLLQDALTSLHLSKAWLQHQLSKQKINNIMEVSLAQLDTKGNLYVDLKGDKPCYTISTKN